jgi:hypothetical protein
VSEVYPKAQAQLPFEEPQEEDLAEQQRQWFLQLAPSSDERVKRLSAAAGIAEGYSGRWREERRRIEEEGTHPYGKSIEMSLLWEGFHEALNFDGTYPYMIWVLAENAEVPSIEHEACRNLDYALSDMLTEIGGMRSVEEENKQRAGADAERGLEELEKWRALHRKTQAS